MTQPIDLLNFAPKFSYHQSTGVSKNDTLDNLINESESLLAQGQLVESRDLAQTALELAQKYHQVRYICEASNLLGLYHSSLMNFTSALEHFKIGLESLKEEKHQGLRSATLNNIGQVYHSLGNTELAESHYRLALEAAPNNYRVMNNLANILGEDGKYLEAEQLFQQALKLAVAADNGRSQIICLGNLGETKRRAGDASSSLEYLKKAEAMLVKSHHHDLATTLELQLGETYRSAKDYDESLKRLTGALDKIRTQGQRKYEVDCLEALQKLYAEMGEYETAYMWSQEALKVSKSLFDTQLSASIATITHSFTKEQEELKYQQIIEKSARLSSIGVMAAGITHEINQPLNSISVSANSILYWNKRNPKILPQLFVEELEQIALGVNRIDEVVRHMRSFWTPTEAQKTEPVKMCDAINNALSLVDRQIFAHGITLVKDLEAAEVIIELNRLDVEQILINLVINAMHALDAFSVDEKKIIIATRVTGKNFELEVQDTGIGLPDVEMDKLFDPLFTTKAPEDGTGLGLAIAQQAAKRMGGRVTAARPPEAKPGAVFTLTIPMTKEDFDAHSAR